MSTIPMLAGAGKSVTVAAAENLRRLSQSTAMDIRLQTLIDAGLADDRSTLLRLIDQLKVIQRSTLGRVKAAAQDAIRKAEPSLLDSNVAIQALGVANVTSIGNENVYLEKDGTAFYFKPANNDRFTVGLHDFSNVVVFE
ncbi:hypothetical protein [Cupriavidus sp. TMH.W2]|uniref:hypothetical protein n=1 Tax=Cupriavidus sp. TMH.W2 TaxID=3434465 RepID=UPI003D76AFB7